MNISRIKINRVAELIDEAFATCDENIINEALRLHRQQKYKNSQKAASSSVSLNSSASAPSSSSSEVVTASSEAKSMSSSSKSGSGQGPGQGPAKFMGRAGTCAVIAVITGGVLFTAHVG
jgi:hypothetical protein